MKSISLPVVIVITMIFVTACSGSAPTVTQVPISQLTAQPVAAGTSVQPVATEPSIAENNTKVDITLGDNTIDSSLTAFQVGVPYTFVITNTGKHSHNFNIAQPVSVAGSLNAALQTALLSVPKDQLGSGTQVTIQYTFPDTATSMQLEFSCLITRHYND